MDANEDYEVTPPDATAVAKRALILAAVACRGCTDNDPQNPDGAARLASRSLEWLHALELDEALSEWERKVLNTQFGRLEERDKIKASWLSEGLTVLAWALQRAEMSGYSVQCDPAEIANALGFLQPKPETVLSHPGLRASPILADYNAFVYNVHWRIRNFLRFRKEYDFESLAKKAWGEPVLRFGLELVEKDIKVGSGPLFKANEHEWREFASITQERHRASNWLVGYASEDFYKVTTDT